MEKKSSTYEHCPHCGAKLTLWQQVLLSVDRMLMCRNCWYRINLDHLSEENGKHNADGIEKERGSAQ